MARMDPRLAKHCAIFTTLAVASAAWYLRGVSGGLEEFPMATWSLAPFVAVPAAVVAVVSGYLAVHLAEKR